jgi:hypothetical protein
LRAVGSPPEKWICSNADFGELGQYFLPFLGRQFAAAAVEFERIGTIRALQRTAMRQLSQHRERDAKGFRRRTAAFEHREPVMRRRLAIGEKVAHDVFSRASVKKTLVGEVLQHGDDIGRDRLARGGVFNGELIDHFRDTADAVAELQHFDRDFVRCQHAFGGEYHPDLPRLIEFQPACRGNFGRLASLTLMLRLAAIDQLSWGTNAPGGMWPST